ncbi:hypothetical protein BDR06DRAFT_245318 [Suillus hirtellus]|nr:hypothetical protein BDR06DRAFT_245318 [Suillus hirtellus]
MHYIDSQGRDGPPDEGTMTSCDGEEVETGIGVNPETGEQEQYEERWIDQPVPPGTSFAFLTSSCEPNRQDLLLFWKIMHLQCARITLKDTEFQVNADTLLPLLNSALSGLDNWKGCLGSQEIAYRKTVGR